MESGHTHTHTHTHTQTHLDWNCRYHLLAVCFRPGLQTLGHRMWTQDTHTHIHIHPPLGLKLILPLAHCVFQTCGLQPFGNQGPVSWKTIFLAGAGRGMVWGWFKHIMFIVHFISIPITSAPPQITRYQILEIGDSCARKRCGVERTRV